MRAAVLLGATGLLAYGAWLLHQQSQESGESIDAVALNTLDNIMQKTSSALGLWRPPQKYAATIAAAEQRHGLPPDLLARTLYQESRYREDIITGAVRSPVGAVGIAQLMPPTAADLGVDPLNPTQSIDAAGRYLAQLYRRFGNWTEALAAYNWGMGNVQRKGLAAAPKETRDYFTQILADVNASNGTAYA